MLSVKDQAQSVYARKLAENGYVTLIFNGSYFGESEGQPRHPELPSVKETDIEGATAFLQSIPFVDPDAIGGSWNLRIRIPYVRGQRKRSSAQSGR